MEAKDLLPIGSVVLMKEGEKKLMVCGVAQKSGGPKSKNYDYIGVLYPEGWISDDEKYLFNHCDIEQVFFRGYEDSEREAFLNMLDQSSVMQAEQPKKKRWFR